MSPSARQEFRPSVLRRRHAGMYLSFSYFLRIMRPAEESETLVAGDGECSSIYLAAVR